MTNEKMELIEEILSLKKQVKSLQKENTELGNKLFEKSNKSNSVIFDLVNEKVYRTKP
jgi:hypothetical protein